MSPIRSLPRENCSSVCTRPRSIGRICFSGAAAIQLAHAEGAFIFTTSSSPAKLDRCRQLGANVMINYKTESFAKRINSVTDGRGVSIILDFVGAPYWNDNLASLSSGGKLM